MEENLIKGVAYSYSCTIKISKSKRRTWELILFFCFCLLQKVMMVSKMYALYNVILSLYEWIYMIIFHYSEHHILMSRASCVFESAFGPKAKQNVSKRSPPAGLHSAFLCAVVLEFAHICYEFAMNQAIEVKFCLTCEWFNRRRICRSGVYLSIGRDTFRTDV